MAVLEQVILDLLVGTERLNSVAACLAWQHLPGAGPVF